MKLASFLRLSLLLLLFTTGCGREGMDSRIDGSSEEAFQRWYASFQKVATQEQDAAFSAGIGGIYSLIYERGVVPESVIRQLDSGFPPIRDTLWETVDGQTPEMVSRWGVEIVRRANEKPQD